MKILLPVDLVHPIEPTATLLRTLCKLEEDEVRLLFVRELLPAYENLVKTAGRFPDDWEKQIDDKAHAALNAAAELLTAHSRQVTTEVTSGPVAATILEAASDEHQDLIVIRPGAHNRAAQFFYGSTTSRIVDNAPCAVLVARPSEKTQLKNVIIAFDGSHDASFALEQACSMFKLAQSQAKVTVVYSVDISEPIKYFSPVAFVAAIEQDMLMEGEIFLATAKKRLAELGVNRVECCLVEGDPPAELIKMSEELDAELIVMGARGHNAMQELLVGSVSHKVAMHAKASVAVIRQPRK